MLTMQKEDSPTIRKVAATTSRPVSRVVSEHIRIFIYWLVSELKPRCAGCRGKDDCCAALGGRAEGLSRGGMLLCNHRTCRLKAS